MTTLGRNDLAAVAALGEPVRRKLYRAVVEAGSPISRDDAAAAVGIPRSTAAVHLGRLVEAGALTAEYRRLSGRTGPGAGRPTKLYSAASGDLLASVPERHYELAGDLLASAAERADRDEDDDARRARCRGAPHGHRDRRGRTPRSRTR